MIGPLRGFGSRLKTISNVVSEIRAGLTDARMGYLDRLDAAISTRATPAQVAAAQLSGVIKSVQRGTASLTTDSSGRLSTTVAITAVNVNKAVVTFNGITHQASTGFCYGRVWLASSTAVGIAVNNGNNGSMSVYVDWQVVEYY